jgi:two-component system sensor histidine kinase YesM
LGGISFREASHFVDRVKKGSLLNYLTISQKMVLIFIGCVIIPLIIQNAFYYTDTAKNIQSQMMQRLAGSLDEKANKINAVISGTVNLSHKYNTKEELYRFLDKYYSIEYDYLIEYQEKIKAILDSDLAYNRHVRKISLYTGNPTVLNGAVVSKITSDDIVSLGEDLIDYNIYNLTESKNGPRLRISLVPPLIKNSYDRSLSIVRPLENYSQYANYCKFLRIDIDVSYISSMLEERGMFDNIVLVDTENRIIASGNTYSEFGEYDRFSADELKEGIVVLKQPLKDLPLSLYGYYNSRIISDEFSKMRWKTFYIIVISMMVSLFCILLVAGNITKRTKLVVNQSRQIANGNFIQIYKDIGGNDEIEILADSMNQMSIKLKTLIEEEYNSRILKAQLEQETTQAMLLALQSQVNPHFLYNALESIRLKAMVRNETETAKMILYMSRMFRRVINWNDDIITLQKEMKFLEEYLSIQKYRFDDEFEYVIQVDDRALDCMLPKFAIQPLVENACVHGVESISGSRLVEIHAALQDDRIIVSVRDNGSGISDDILNNLKEILKKGSKPIESVGLYNVYQRLVLYYGKEFTFDVKSELGKGTEFNITIPVRHSKEEFYVLNSVGG